MTSLIVATWSLYPCTTPPTHPTLFYPRLTHEVRDERREQSGAFGPSYSMKKFELKGRVLGQREEVTNKSVESQEKKNHPERRLPLFVRRPVKEKV